MLSQEEIRAAIASVLNSAQSTPPIWSGGIDLSQQRASVGLANPETFRPAKFTPTGYRGLDVALGGGWANGECSTLVAPSNVGKSCAMVNLALRAALLGFAVAIISLEMREFDIWKLIAGVLANVRRTAIRQGKMTNQETARLAHAIRTLSSNNRIYVIDRRKFPVDSKHPEAPTMDAIGRTIQDGVRNCQWTLVFIDYLGKVGPFNCEDLVRMPRLTNWSFDLAQRSNAHLVCLMQSGKAAYGRTEGKNKKPTVRLEDAKGAVEVIADFDNCIGLSRADWNTEKHVDPADMKAITNKARQGPGGVLPLMFYKSTGKIVEVTAYLAGNPTTTQP